MDKKEIYKKELAAYLTALYHSGSPYSQQRLFEVNGKEDKNSIDFFELIRTEAAKREVEPLQLIDYFAENREEFFRLLGIQVPEKFRPVSNQEALIPKCMLELSKRFNITQLSKSDYIGTVEIEEYGLMEKWEKDIGYLVRSIDFIEKMDSKIPKPNAYLDKVIKTLIFLIEQQANKSGEYITRAKGSFYLSKLAEFLNMGRGELKRTLICGMCLIYEYPNKINGVDYTYYGSWYNLNIPKHDNHPWYYEFTGLYGDQIIGVINEAHQYLKHPIKELADNKTHKKQYLHSFYNQLVYNDLPMLVSNLMSKMGIKKDRLDRPGQCFDILKDCIVYTHENHPEMLEKFYISKYYHRPKTGAKDRRPINIEDLKNVSYKDFKVLLNGMGIADIREAYVKFKKQPKEKTEHFALSDADNRLIDEITTWAEDWEAYKEGNGLPFTKTERKKFLSDCIRYMGHQELEKSFIEEQETEKEDPFGNTYRFDDPIGYFTKRLPELLREDKQRKGDALKG